MLRLASGAPAEASATAPQGRAKQRFRDSVAPNPYRHCFTRRKRPPPPIQATVVHSATRPANLDALWHHGHVGDMPICAYCEQHSPGLTREHLWPKSLHKRINERNRSIYNEDNRFYLGKIDKTIDAEPQIRDVCGDCNNGPLSLLDGYICELWDQYFHRIVPADEQIAFAFDYSLLTRWLLKMSFNSARISGNGVSHLEKCREYILRGGAPPAHVVVHLQLLVPSELNEEQRALFLERGIDEIQYLPRENRVGHLGYRTRFGYRLVRTVFLQSFLFLIHLFPDKVDQDRRVGELKDFALQFPCQTPAAEDRPFKHNYHLRRNGRSGVHDCASRTQRTHPGSQEGKGDLLIEGS